MEDQKQISRLLHDDVKKIAEDFIQHIEQVGGLNRFNLTIFLLTAARYGYNKAKNPAFEYHKDM